MTRTFILVAMLAILIPAETGADTRMYGDIDGVMYNGLWDGDTFYATIPSWPAIVGDSIKIRIATINCHEWKSDQDSTHPAVQAKAFTDSVLREADVISLRNLRRGSFFRVIADVEVDGTDLGQMLMDAGLCRKYSRDGRKVIVYRTPSGSKYHLAGCQHLARSKSVTELLQWEAIAAKLTPCKVCKPPGLDGETE